jgi:hypothetical protein
MATYLSKQLTVDYRRYPIDDHGKLRFQYGSVDALASAYASADQIDLIRMPPGRVRILPWLSRYWSSAWGASRTLSLGNRAYSSRPSAQAVQEAELGTTFLNAVDVSAAVNAVAFGTSKKFDIYSVTEWTIFATIGGGTMPAGATLDIELAYLYE